MLMRRERSTSISRMGITVFSTLIVLSCNVSSTAPSFSCGWYRKIWLWFESVQDTGERQAWWNARNRELLRMSSSGGVARRVSSILYCSSPFIKNQKCLPDPNQKNYVSLQLKIFQLTHNGSPPLSFSVGAPTYSERAGTNMRKVMKLYAERVRQSHRYRLRIENTTTTQNRIDEPRKRFRWKVHDEKKKEKKKKLPVLLRNNSDPKSFLTFLRPISQRRKGRSEKKKKKLTKIRTWCEIQKYLRIPNRVGLLPLRAVLLGDENSFRNDVEDELRPVVESSVVRRFEVLHMTSNRLSDSVSKERTTQIGTGDV